MSFSCIKKWNVVSQGSNEDRCELENIFLDLKTRTLVKKKKNKKTNIQADGHSTKQLAVFFKMSVSGNNTKTEKLSRLQKTDIKQNSLCFYGREIRGIWTSSLQRTLKKFRGKKTTDIERKR